MIMIEYINILASLTDLLTPQLHIISYKGNCLILLKFMRFHYRVKLKDRNSNNNQREHFQ